MAERPEDQQNWQLRQYDSFGPHFRIDSGNPQLGYNGAVVYDLLGSGKDGNTSTVGMTEAGLYHMYNDQCIEIMGGNKVVLETNDQINVNSDTDDSVDASLTIMEIT